MLHMPQHIGGVAQQAVQLASDLGLGMVEQVNEHVEYFLQKRSKESMW